MQGYSHDAKPNTRFWKFIAALKIYKLPSASNKAALIEHIQIYWYCVNQQSLGLADISIWIENDKWISESINWQIDKRKDINSQIN